MFSRILSGVVFGKPVAVLRDMLTGALTGPIVGWDTAAGET